MKDLKNLLTIDSFNGTQKNKHCNIKAYPLES